MPSIGHGLDADNAVVEVVAAVLLDEACHVLNVRGDVMVGGEAKNDVGAEVLREEAASTK